MFKSHLICLGAVAAILGAPAAFAQSEDDHTELVAPPQETLIVIGSRDPDGRTQHLYGGSFTVLSTQALEDRQIRFGADALRDVPSVAVSRSGGPATLTDIRIRGAEANHTLVFIDGVEASDPFLGQFDFGALLAEPDAYVEVLRGPQSALYGSDAIGGVVSYATVSPQDKRGFSGRAEGGSFGTGSVAARYVGEAGPLGFALSGGHTRADGFNIARAGSEDDGFRTSALSGKFTYDATYALQLRGVARYVDTRADVDPQPGAEVVDDPAPFFSQISRSALLGATLKLGDWTQTLDAQALKVERRNHDAFPFFTDGGREKLSYVSAYRFTQGLAEQTLTVAADWKRETYRNLPTGGPPAPLNAKRSLTTAGVVGEYRLDFDRRIGLAAAVRYDSNDRFDDDATWRLEGAYRFRNGVKMRAAAGTGVKNPTNFELFGFDPTRFVGNPNLKPERSTSVEAGFDAPLPFGDGSFSATVFHAELDDEIFTAFGGPPSFLSTPKNRDTASKQDGAELGLRATLAHGLRLQTQYAWLDARENGVREVRRPQHSGSLNLDWRSDDARGGAFLTVRYAGDAADDVFDFPARRTTLPAHTTVDLGGDVGLSETLKLYARVENATDETYEEVYSYRTAGRAFYAGLKVAY